MSSDMEDGDVILIAPSANQDGSQTFFILDPCPSSEDTDERHEIELVDLPAEVKNTGAIAVLSTNSNTGALEITVSKKIETMDQTKNVVTHGLNDSNTVKTPSIETHPKDEFTIKLEEEFNDDEINIDDCIENSEPEPRSDPDSLNYEVIELNQQNDTEQEDDVEEGTLYIDDNKCYEMQEDISEENNVYENIETEEKYTLNSSGDSITECTVADHKTRVEEISKKDGNDSIESIAAVNQNQDLNNHLEGMIEMSNNHEANPQPSNSTCGKQCTEPSGVFEAVIHGHLMKIPCGTENTPNANSANDSFDSTNTALTLLELAGRSPCRNLEQNSVELEMLQLEENGSDASASLTRLETQPAPELTTLTTLQPVPLESSVESSFCNEISDSMVGQPETSVIHENVPPESSATSENVQESSNVGRNVPGSSDVPSNVVAKSNIQLPGRKVRVSNELVQRLLESEDSSRRPQYKHLTRPSVSKSEIAKEIYERARQKYPYREESNRDVFFAMKIAHRLASKIVSPEKSNEVLEKSNTELSSLSPSAHGTPKSRKDLIFRCNEEGKTLPRKKDAILDNIELLKILEDDPDDPDSDVNQSPTVLDKKPKIRVSRPRAPLLKLHPELEKELALKQLQNFAPKKKVEFVPEVLKKDGRGRPKKNHEHNNNSQVILAKRKMNDSSSRGPKKMKNEVEDETATVDPSQITETLVVEGQDLVEEQVKDGKSIKQYSNKRLSRTSETPPREVPIEILLNGMEDEVSEEKLNVSKNKIFKATNPKKRQEELKKKHFANVLQRNKPHKKRGRPPKKKPVPTDDMLNKEFIMKVINEPNKVEKSDKEEKMSNQAVVDEEIRTSSKEDKPLKTKKMREIERLLGDEGAINMLYSVEQKRQTGGEPKRGVLPSYRRKKKDLMLKTKLVKSAVLRLSASPVQATGRISLRGQGVKDGEDEEQNDEVSLRKMSVDSRDSHQSLSSPPTETFSFPAKIVPAEASRIIRRHSSSSNYSSRSNSPRRLSVDGERFNLISPEISSLETAQGESPLPVAAKHKPQQTNGELGNKKSEHSEWLLNTKFSGNSSEECFQLPKTSVDIKKSQVKTPTNSKLKSNFLVEQNPVKRPGRPRKRICSEEINRSAELNTLLAAAVDEFTKEIENHKNTSERTPKSAKYGNSGGTSSKVAVYSKNTHGTTRKRGRTSVVYHELSLKRQPNLVEIILDPVSSKIKNALNIDVMRELVAVLTGLVKDENCRVVLLSSAGNIFCQGVDFPALVKPTTEQRMTAAQDMALSLKELIKTMASFPKPIVVAVQGPAVGLGTTLLPLCDLVVSSSEATFHTPYSSLGQVPEGAATLTLPSLIGYAATSELLFLGRKLSALEAQQQGLVTRILPTETYEEDLMSYVTTLASQSSQAMSATKALLRHSLLTSLETTLVSETHLLTQHWASDECQAVFSKYLQNNGQGEPSFIFTQPT